MSGTKLLFCFHCVSVRHYQNDCYFTVNACLVSKMAHVVYRVQERTKERLNCTNLCCSTMNMVQNYPSVSFTPSIYTSVGRRERRKRAVLRPGATASAPWKHHAGLSLRRITCSCSLFICKKKTNKKNNLNRKSLVALFSFSFFVPLILQIWLTIKQVHKKYTPFETWTDARKQVCQMESQ